MTKHHVLILGGGFAGVEAAIALRKKGHKVALISNRDYFYIYPISIWIPTGELDFEDAKVPLDAIAKAHDFELILDEVQTIHSREKRVTCAHGEHIAEYLVIAIGSGKMKHAGSENFLSICGVPETSLEIKARIDALMAQGSGTLAVGFGGNPKDASNVRGGPAFEVLFNLHHLLTQKGIRDAFELIFFAPMENPGARMGHQAVKMMDLYFDKLGITTQVGKKSNVLNRRASSSRTTR